ncbi:MAG: corrinoid protein-associated methyltransferase CpaM, partial [Anaerolineae bacterium]
MATVFMKFLETSPQDYDRGISIITLGQIRRIKERIAQELVQPGDRVLEIGCGTGTLAVLCARRGAHVTATDASPLMLSVARKRVEAEELGDRIDLHQMDATTLADHFPAYSFDVIVSTLVFSELGDDGLRYVLEECQRLLKDDGRLVIADEVVPEGFAAKLAFYAVRLPMLVITWLITRTTTRALSQFGERLEVAGFRGQEAASHLAGSLKLFVAQKRAPAEAALPQAIPSLVHRITPWTLLKDLWCLFFRAIPPYPAVRPGLYAIGSPGRSSPVLVTGNYDLTVRRVVRDIQGVDAYLLVADSRGINVWCAAGGGHFTAEKVIAAVKTSGVERFVDHHTLILPQLCANGVDGWRVRQETGWHVRWGPTYSQDIPAYLAASRHKTEEMRRVKFPLQSRLEMVAVVAGFYGLLMILPVAIFWRAHLIPVLASMVALGLAFGVFMPWLPGRNGLSKGAFLAGLSVVLTIAWSLFAGHLGPRALFNWCLGLSAMAIFVG